MTSEDELEELIERVVSAWRPRDADGQIRSHPAWHDLPPERRRDAAERAADSRILEAALDEDGFSSTVNAVLARIRGQ